MVQTVDTHFTVNVDDVVIVHYNSHVVYFAIVVVEKGQVAGLALLDKTKGPSLGRLL